MSKLKTANFALISYPGLRRDDVQASASVRAAIVLAATFAIQVEAASLAARQAQARYQAGLATVAQVAEADQILADSQLRKRWQMLVFGGHCSPWRMCSR